MYQPLEAITVDDRTRLCSLPCPSALTPDLLARQRPDASWMLLDDAGSVAARCSLWWKAAPPHGEERLGLIGHYAARNAEAAAQLLRLACQRLAEQHCTLTVGPMDGNTWQRYRLLTERGDEPAFFLEPDNPDDWPAHFTSNGFTPLAQYYSALNSDLADCDLRAENAAALFDKRNMTLRTLHMDRFEEELRRIHALSLAGFAGNFLYTPISAEDFVAQYLGVKPYVRPELVLIAEQHGQAIGFIFAIPDMLQARRGQSIDTVIIKTMAVHPDHAGAGLGTLLMARCEQAAGTLGYHRAIHALFHEANPSGKISRHTAKVIRRYILFAKRLTP
jgi:GNAT superfamily N-acetyltransferase